MSAVIALQPELAVATEAQRQLAQPEPPRNALVMDSDGDVFLWANGEWKGISWSNNEIRGDWEFVADGMDALTVYLPVCAGALDDTARLVVAAAVAAEADIWRRALQTVLSKGGRDS